MRTSVGQDCSYYYEDFNRGASVRQCRIARAKESDHWTASHCGKCPVPDIQTANSSRYLDLTLDVRSRMFGRTPRFSVESWCVLHGPIEDPYVGCAECAAELERALEGAE